MTPHRIIAAIVLLLTCAVLLAHPSPMKIKVHVTHFGYPGDPLATANTRHDFGDHNNINPDSVAVTPDLDSRVSVRRARLHRGKVSRIPAQHT
jgi:hypothetical protein